MLKLCDIRKEYISGEIREEVLKGVSLEIQDGEIVSIVGKSGAGKSTLLNIASGMDRPTSGQVWVDDEEISSYSEKQLTNLRLNRFGYVFQEYFLVSTLTALENIVITSLVRNGSYDEEWLKSVLDFLGLNEKINNYPYQMSGGEQQRVAIARAIMTKPSVLFADEPTGNLDAINSKSVRDLLFSYAKEYNCSLVYVTHDDAFAEEAERQIRISDGQIITEKE